MGRRDFGIDVRLQYKPGAVPFSLGNTCAPAGTSACRGMRSVDLIPRFDNLSAMVPDLFARLSQFQSEKFCRDFACDIVGRRSESASDENNFRSRKEFAKRVSNRRSIRNGALLVNSQSQRENLPRDESEVLVLDIAEQKLGAGVNEDDAKIDKQTSNAQRSTSNAEVRSLN